MNVVVGVIKSGPNGASEVDKDTYECVVEVPEYGMLNGRAVRVENEPKVGDEVLCFVLPDPYGNNSIFLPLKILSGNDFVGIARQGYKLEFSDSGITIQGKGDSPKTKIELTGSKLTIETGGGKMELDSNTNEMKISGYSLGINIKGTVAPDPTGGPFCALPNCLFSGAPHQGNKIMGN